MRMFKTWRIGRLLGFPIEVGASFLLLLGVVMLWMGGLWGVVAVGLTFSSVVLHELGHAVVARRLGVPVSRIGLHFFGGAAQLTDTPRRASDEIAIAAAGPAVSLALAGAGLGLGAVLGSPLVGLIGWINLVLAVFNLIPALPMDGGRILRALLTRRLDYVRATDASVTVARVVAVAFGVIGVAAGSLQLVVLAPILWMMGNRERMLARVVAPRIGYDRGGYRDHGHEVLPRRRGWGFHAYDDDGDDGDGDDGGGPRGPRGPRRIVIRTAGGRWIIER